MTWLGAVYQQIQNRKSSPLNPVKSYQKQFGSVKFFAPMRSGLGVKTSISTYLLSERSRCCYFLTVLHLPHLIVTRSKSQRWASFGPPFSLVIPVIRVPCLSPKFIYISSFKWLSQQGNTVQQRKAHPTYLEGYQAPEPLVPQS